MGGKSGSSSPPKAPKPPKPPPPPPTMIKARKKARKKEGFAGRTTAENIRNEGGGSGMSTADTERALKKLTG